MATPARTVQLKNANQVMEAYQNWENPQFAILNGKQLLFAYDKEDANLEEGEQLLEQWLAWIKNGGSAGIYTLAIYKDTRKGITNATPYNGSINFQLNEYSYNGGSMNGANNEGLKLIMDKMESMQLQLNKLQQEIEDDDDDEEEKEADTLGQITDFLSNPVIAGLLGSLIPNGNKTLKPASPMPPTQTEPGNVARITGTTENDSQQRMADSLRKLQTAIPNLPDVLDQMCKLAEQKPNQFKFYMASLMAMKL